MKLKYVTLENGEEYMIISEVKKDEIIYLYLVNDNIDTDFCIRKVIKEDGKEYIVSLRDEEELKLALSLFNKWCR